MKQNPHFCLIKIGTKHYLVPFGQDIENMRPSLRMNEASSFLWEKLSECTDEKELVFALAREYEVPEGELPKITKDVRTMLRQFFAVGAVRNDYPGREEFLKTAVRMLSALKNGMHFSTGNRGIGIW